MDKHQMVLSVWNTMNLGQGGAFNQAFVDMLIEWVSFEAHQDCQVSDLIKNAAVLGFDANYVWAALNALCSTGHAELALSSMINNRIGVKIKRNDLSKWQELVAVKTDNKE